VVLVSVGIGIGVDRRNSHSTTPYHHARIGFKSGGREKKSWVGMYVRGELEIRTCGSVVLWFWDSGILGFWDG